MTVAIDKKKIEYGDFQTPLELAKQVCQKLLSLGINPDAIIEPTCGVGNFVEAAIDSFSTARRVIGVEVNSDYLEKLNEKKDRFKDRSVEIKHDNFFNFDWSSLIDKSGDNVLVLGNFPWVTNSQQGAIGGNNLPDKNNFQNHSGLDAITGKSNFDISEWMLIKTIEWLQHYNSHLAMLCKASVARKLLSYMRSEEVSLNYCATYGIDAKRYFNASVEACLLVCQFKHGSRNYSCDVFSSFEDSKPYQIGYCNGVLVRNPTVFEKLESLYTNSSNTKWRSGIKHDCSSVMEFVKNNGTYVNSLGESVELEETYLFPLIKGSDVAQNRIQSTDRYVLVPQKFVGESTEFVREIAPKTWNYLEAHGDYLDRRKSRIYQQNPRFSIFGVGSYTFAPWKIAICGLYKKLEFRLVGQINQKPTIFDDTVYFLSFEDEQIAQKTLKLLTSPPAIDFYSCLIFWDEKRPIKSSVLNALNLEVLAEINP